jgi:hypothetical protein
MQIKVGPFRYEIIASPTNLKHPDGGECHGLARPDLNRVEFSSVAPPDKRMAVVWHEIGHLLKADLDITGSLKLDEESICNLIGLAMSMMSPMDMLRLHVYVAQGVDAPGAMLYPGLPSPIPVFHFTLDS